MIILKPTPTISLPTVKEERQWREGCDCAGWKRASRQSGIVYQCFYDENYDDEGNFLPIYIVHEWSLGPHIIMYCPWCGKSLLTYREQIKKEMNK